MCNLDMTEIELMVAASVNSICTSPTNNISSEFQIRWKKIIAIVFKRGWSNHHKILHIPRQDCWLGMCKIFDVTWQIQ